jgi:hypothetical protein
VNVFREAGPLPYEESGVMSLRIDKTAARKVRQVRDWRDGGHLEEGIGPAGKWEVCLVEKLRPNSDIETQVGKWNDVVVNRLPIFNICASPEDLVAR